MVRMRKKEEVEKVEKVEEEVQDTPAVEESATEGVLQRLGYSPGDTVDLATSNKLSRR